MEPLRATITSRTGQTRILIQHGHTDLLIAKLGPLHGAHRYALRSLLEGIALWFHEQVHVVLCVDESLALCDDVVDALGIGVETLHFKVEVVPLEQRAQARRRKRLRGLGSFAPERRHLRLVPSP